MPKIQDVKSVGLPYRAEANDAINAHDLEEFHERHARETYWARVVLITLVFGMQALNLWMTQRNYEAMIIDVDASRQAASEIDEQTTVRLESLNKRLEAIEAKLPVPVAAVLAEGG